jgi:hypothetical protein
VTPENSPVFTESFVSVMDTPDEFRKLVEVKSPEGLVDMFRRPYPRKVALWVHHFDDYGVIVEGTYDIVLAKRALKKAGYLKGEAALWGYRPMAVEGRSAVAFYFDVVASM